MNDPEMVAILAAGLEAQDWRETASISADWRRFGKFGRGAMYVILHDCKVAPGPLHLKAGELWFSDLHLLTPQVEVVGPILDQVFDAGCKAQPAFGRGRTEQNRRSVSIDADKALDELIGGSE